MMGAAAVLVILLALSALRIILGPTPWDRLLGFALVTTKLVMLIVLVALIRDQSMFLDIGLIFALLGFIGVVFLSGTIQRNGGHL